MSSADEGPVARAISGRPPFGPIERLDSGRLREEQEASRFTEDFGQYDSMADLFRQIGYDARLHKLQSEAAIGAPRFT